MNATIQSLSNILELSDFLLKKLKVNSFDVNKHPLSISFSCLLQQLFYPEENKKYIKPNLFKEIIGELNPLFKGMHAADAKDLIFFIIEKLHQELNDINPNQQQTPQLDLATQEEMSKNENMMLNLFVNDFKAKNHSKISDIFYGVTRSTMKCNNCNVTKYSFQTFNILIFQLKKVKDEMEKMLGGSLKSYNYKLGLIDAFNVDKKEEKLEGENMIYCNNCKSLQNGEHQQCIYSLPKVLIIILNRGKNNQDFNEEFEIPLKLDFTNQGIIFSPESKMVFYLSCVITHLGESGTDGHFIAYCRTGPNSPFYCYNDASVSPVDDKSAIETKISHIESNKKTPYILLYHEL